MGVPGGSGARGPRLLKLPQQLGKLIQRGSHASDGFVSSTLLNLIVVPIGFELFDGGPREDSGQQTQEQLLG